MEEEAASQPLCVIVDTVVSQVVVTHKFPN